MMRWIFIILMPGLACAGPLERGLKAKQEGRLEEATRELAVAVEKSPDQVLAWFHYATVLGWQKSYQEASKAYDKGLALAPEDHDLRLGKARLLSWQEQYGKSLEILDELAKDYPQSEGVLVTRGRVASWNQQQDLAQRAYEQVLDLNPRHMDALVGMGDLAKERGDVTLARGYYLRARDIEASLEVLDRLSALDDLEQWRVDAGVRVSSFRKSSRSDWLGTWTQVTRIKPGGAWWLKVEHEERFKNQDTSLVAGIIRDWGEGEALKLWGGGSPDADWAEEWMLGAEMRTRLGDDGWLQWAGVGPQLVGEFRYSSYRPRGVWLSRCGFDQDFDGAGTFSLRWIRVDAEGSPSLDGYSIAWRRQMGESRWLRAGFASTAESITSDSLGAGGGILKSKTYFMGLGGDLSESVAWRLDLERELVEGSADRNGISMGLQYRF